MATKQHKQLLGSVIGGLLIVGVVAFLYKGESAPCPNKLRPVAYPQMSIDELILKVRNGEDVPEMVQTAGFILFKYKCPPCPEGAQCKPCMPNNMVVGSQPAETPDYGAVLGDQQIIVYMDDPSKFADQMRYLFILKNAKVSTTGLVQTEFVECALSP